MNGINKIFLAGNLVKKPEVYKSKNGKPYSFLKIATNRYSYKEGVWNKKTDWHSILVWGKKAELCERWLEKGTPLAVEGFLENNTSLVEGKYIDKTLVIAEDVHFLGLRGHGDMDREPMETSPEDKNDSGGEETSLFG